MTRQAISIGTTANDGTGDTLRSAAIKINQTFVELYQYLGGDSDTISSQVSFEADALVFEGSSTDEFETRLKATNVTSDVVLTLPGTTGEIISTTATQTLTNKTLTTPTIVTPKIANGIQDQFGNEILTLSSTSSAVNEITITNNTTTNPPAITATGGDTNINLNVSAKGTGSVKLSKAAYSAVSVTSGASPVSTTASYVIFDSSASAYTITLSDGTLAGEYKIFTNRSTQVITVQPTNFAQGTRFRLANKDGCTCIWDGSEWYIVGNQGEITIVA